jgi:hypothetical protein
MRLFMSNDETINELRTGKDMKGSDNGLIWGKRNINPEFSWKDWPRVNLHFSQNVRSRGLYLQVNCILFLDVFQ